MFSDLLKTIGWRIATWHNTRKQDREFWNKKPFPAPGIPPQPKRMQKLMWEFIVRESNDVREPK